MSALKYELTVINLVSNERERKKWIFWNILMSS